MTNKPEKLYSTSEAAVYCGVGMWKIKRNLLTGALKPDVVQPRCLLFTQDTLDAWKAIPDKPRGRPFLPISKFPCTCGAGNAPGAVHAKMCRRELAVTRRKRTASKRSASKP